MAENQNQLPVDNASTPTSSVFDTLKKYSLDYGKQAFEAANATAAPAARGDLKLPQLIESTQTGYVNGSSKAVVCCAVAGHTVEKNTAYDYILMANAAAKDGVTLKITSAFRDNETQTRLFNERKNPAVAKEKGVAAKPGYSNHQAGIALDIDVGMHKSDFIAGRFTAAFLWLQKYGPEFGFSHEEGASVQEPWHWTHPPTKIVGIAAFQSATGLAVLTADTAVNASASGQSGTLRVVHAEGHDDTVALARATTFGQTSRQTLMSERSIFSAQLSNYTSSRVSQLEAAVATIAVEPKAFEPESLSSLVYNFATGLWGDSKPV